MEYPDVINATNVSRAATLTRNLLLHRNEALSVLAEEAVAQTFCTCVTGGEDAAEGHLSVIHAALIQTVVAEVSKGSSYAAAELQA